MRWGLRLAILIFAVGASSGCGTMHNLSGCCTPAECRIYGGVRSDLTSISSRAVTNQGTKALIQAELWRVGILFLDLPACVIGDTLTLPIKLTATLTQQSPEKQTPSQFLDAEMPAQ